MTRERVLTLSYRLIIIGDKSALEPDVSIEDTTLLRRAFACEISVQFQKVTGRLSKPTGAREPYC
jgi:hypothetical protein